MLLLVCLFYHTRLNFINPYIIFVVMKHQTHEMVVMLHKAFVYMFGVEIIYDFDFEQNTW